MRKTSSYLEKKLTLIQKLNILNWLKNDIQSNNNKERRKSSGKGFYRYPSRQAVEEKFAKGVPLSSFTLDGNDNSVFVAYGRQKNVIQYAKITYYVPSNFTEECGFCFANCTLSNDVFEKPRQELLNEAQSFALPLPYQRRNRSFAKEYAFVFDDWDILGSHSGKAIASLCERLFSIDVMAD